MAKLSTSANRRTRSRAANLPTTTPAPDPGTADETFVYTGAYEEFIVPVGVSTLTVDMWGAQGGNYVDGTKPGALGGRVKCDLTVTPEETLRIYVGGQGVTSPDGLTVNAGGFPDGGATAAGGGGGTGGGSSQIRRTPYANGDRLVIAGGGGGAGSLGTPGGGGTPDGQNSSTVSGTIAYGGTASAGGAAGSGGGGSTSGSLGQGGAGGSFAGCGGGGRYGGGGGATSWSACAGGGSGLSTGVAELIVNATRSGNGQLTLSWTP